MTRRSARNASADPIKKGREREVGGEQPAQQRAQDHTHADHGAELSHPLAFFARWSVISDIGHGGRHGG